MSAPDGLTSVHFWVTQNGSVIRVECSAECRSARCAPLTWLSARGKVQPIRPPVLTPCHRRVIEDRLDKVERRFAA